MPLFHKAADSVPSELETGVPGQEHILVRLETQFLQRHVDAVDGVEKGIEPDDRKKDGQRREIGEGGDRDDAGKQQHQGDAPLHQAVIHLAGAGDE